MKNSVSLIIPTHNRKDSVIRAIQSALQQDYVSLEIIVVADSCSDGTEIALAAHSDCLTVISGNFGASSKARNAGASAAAGELLVFLDDDDVLEQEAIPALARLMDENPSASVGYGLFKYDVVGGWSEVPQTPLRNAGCSGRVLAELAINNFIVIGAVVVRRSAYESVGGFDESLVYDEDWALWLKLARYGTFAFCDQCLAGITLHPANKTLEIPKTSQIDILWRSLLHKDKLVLTAHDVSHLDRSQRLAVAIKLYTAIGQKAYAEQNYALARRAMLRAARFAPAIVFKTDISRLFIQTFLPTRILEVLRHLRQDNKVR